MDGVGIAPATLTPLMQRFPQFIGLKEASHNWEKYLELGRAAKLVRADFGLFVGTEWMLPCLTLGGTACMSIFGGIAPNFINALYDAMMSGRLKERARSCNTNFPSSTRSPRSNIRRRPRRCGRSWAGRSARRGCPTGRSRRKRKKEIRSTLETLGLFDTEPHGW